MFLTNRIQKKDIHKLLILFSPEQLLPKYIQNPKDIIDNKWIIRELKCSDFVVNYLSEILLDALETSKRFRQLECLKILKYIIKYQNNGNDISSDTISKLFKLYKHYIFSKNDDIQWCVSVFIKDQILGDSEIEWLILNYKYTIHIVNRLLLYPRSHELIKGWAKIIYMNNEYPDRINNVVALLIDNDIPEFIKDIDSIDKIWAIYNSRISVDDKERLIIKYSKESNVLSVAEVALRLNNINILKNAINRISD
jgi:hypothetical protein